MRKSLAIICLCFLFSLQCEQMAFGVSAFPKVTTMYWDELYDLARVTLKITAGKGDDFLRYIQKTVDLDDIVRLIGKMPQARRPQVLLELCAVRGLVRPTDALRFQGLLQTVPHADDVLLTAIKQGDDVGRALQFASSVASPLRFQRVSAIFTAAQIDELAELPVGEAGKRLGALRLSTPMLEDTYLRILLKQGKVTTKYADDLAKNLGGTKGFVATMRKASSANEHLEAGHLFELALANSASQKGFSVVEIGGKFADPAKKALTDLDVLLEKNGQKYVIEAKNYTDVDWPVLPTFRADMESLAAAEAFVGSSNRYFVISNVPSNPNVLRALQEAAESRNVELVFGSAEDIIAAIDQSILRLK